MQVEIPSLTVQVPAEAVYLASALVTLAVYAAKSVVVYGLIRRFNGPAKDDTQAVERMMGVICWPLLPFAYAAYYAGYGIYGLLYKAVSGDWGGAGKEEE